MIDPKMLELSIYEGIPHLLCPVVTDMKEAANALRWSVAEMERRYRLMAAMGVRNLAGFNRKVKDAQKAGEPLTDPLYRRESMEDIPPELETLPVIVVVIDEFADMMMIVGKKVEELIAELKSDYTVVIVTHNMQQAARVSDRTGFFNLEATGRPGELVEFDTTQTIFNNPSQKATEDYISGRFG